MSKICNIDLESRGEISGQIEQYCQEIIRELNPRQIILFGSFATGDINEGSDIDILVIADFQLSFLDRIKLLLELNRFDLPIEPIGYTAEEFDRMRQAGNSFISRAVEEGKIMYRKTVKGKRD